MISGSDSAVAHRLAQHLAHGIGDLFVPAIGHGDRQQHRVVSRRRRLRRADRRDRAVRQQFEPADRLHPHPAPMDLRIADQGAQLRLQRAQNAGDLLRLARQIVGRAHP